VKVNKIKNFKGLYISLKTRQNRFPLFRVSFTHSNDVQGKLRDYSKKLQHLEILTSENKQNYKENEIRLIKRRLQPITCFQRYYAKKSEQYSTTHRQKMWNATSLWNRFDLQRAYNPEDKTRERKTAIFYENRSNLATELHPWQHSLSGSCPWNTQFPVHNRFCNDQRWTSPLCSRFCSLRSFGSSPSNSPQKNQPPRVGVFFRATPNTRRVCVRLTLKMSE